MIKKVSKVKKPVEKDMIFSLRIDKGEHEQVSKIAQQESRKIADQYRFIIKEYLKNHITRAPS